MSFLELERKRILIAGVSNKRSVATFIARTLSNEGAELLFSVQKEIQAEFVRKEFPGCPCFLCDASSESDLESLASALTDKSPIHGLVHSLAFANYSGGIKPFHEISREDFIQAFDASCLSLPRMIKWLKPLMDINGAVVAMSISSTTMTSESYGFMAPIKAALDSSVCFLAKSLSSDTRIRVNAVGAGLLKTSASAGIPGYVDSYIFAEMATMRKSSLLTQEAADAAVFLLSAKSSGINAQTIVVDAGMSRNYFDSDIVRHAVSSKIAGHPSIKN